MSQLDPITRALQSAVETGVFPGAVLLVRLRGRILYERTVGLASLIPEKKPASPDTIYDLASLTKPLATATSILCLIQEGRLGLNDPLERFLDELAGSPLGHATIGHLLTHSAGLPAWRPFYERIAEQDRQSPGFLGSEQAKQFALELIRQEPLLAPAGMRSLYSDLGFILLGFVIERLAGCSLATFVRERAYEPIKAEPLFFVRCDSTIVGGSRAAGGRPKLLGLVAPTEEDPWRGRVLCGEVHDENAYALGGIAGHSGLFGTAAAVLAVSGCWLDSYLGRESLLRSDLVRRFVTRQDLPAGSSWGLGWDTPSVPSSSGTRFSPKSFGHLGFTGTSLWIDPERELEVVLLSNRVHPTRKNEKIREFRPKIHDIIYEELIADG
jgi:CubicO group peptidase (beta-lactamase class C family)